MLFLLGCCLVSIASADGPIPSMALQQMNELHAKQENCWLEYAVVDQLFSEDMEENGSVIIPFHAYQTTYKVFAIGDVHSISDIDISVYDANGTIIVEDAEVDDYAEVTFKGAGENVSIEISCGQNESLGACGTLIYSVY
jgi:hypothetical protein